MNIQELVEFQRAFDARHAGVFQWDTKISDDNVPMLGFTMLALAGEAGEAANLVKKMWRGDFRYTEKRQELCVEIADIFAYLLKLTYQLGFDLEETYLSKMKENEKRFGRYDRPTE